MEDEIERERERDVDEVKLKPLTCRVDVSLGAFFGVSEL